MKTLILALHVSSISSFSVFGQCWPNPYLSTESSGFWPDTFQTVYACLGCGSHDRVVDIVTITDTVMNIDTGQGNIVPVTLYVDAVKLLQFSNIPAGMTYGTNVDSDTSVHPTQSPWGIWYNEGVVPNQNPAIGCIYFSGDDSAWFDLASLSNLGQDLGGAHLSIAFDYRIASTEPNISSLIPNNTWISNVAPNLGGGPFVLDKYWLVSWFFPWSVGDSDSNGKRSIDNHPNPFNGSTVISFESPQVVDYIDLIVYNSMGQVLEIQHKNGKQGLNQFAFDGSKLPPGIYPYLIKTEDFSGWGKFVIRLE